MRRYSLLVTLLLSLLLPLHVAASTLLSAPTCPAEVAMDASAATDSVAMDCCDEDEGKGGCDQMQACHGCNISCQLLTFSTPDFNVSLTSLLHLPISTPFVASFDPAAVWRPPTNS